jgi:magnesium transporter
MAEKRFFHIRSQGKLERVSTLEQLLPKMKEGGYVWLDYFDPCEEDLTPLVEHFGVHALTIEDCLDEDQIPKMEDFQGHAFMLLNGCRYESGKMILEEADFILGKNFLVTVSGHSGGSLKFYEKVEAIAASEPREIKHGPDFLLQLVMENLVDTKFTAIESLQDEIDAAEEQVLYDPTAFRPERLILLRRQLLTLRKSLFHEREILVKICRRDCSYVSEKAIYHYRDIYDHLAKYFEIVEIYREMITSLMEIYLSMINNRMAEVANGTNATMRRLTVINTIFMPLTLLAGIGGMSEYSMMTGSSNWRIAYPVFLLLMVVIGGLNWYLLKWFEARKSAV